MRIRQIRNATIVIEFGGKRFLVDPWLAPKDTYPGYAGCMNDHIRNPTAPLVVAMDEIVNVDAVVLTHSHPDHWDDFAAENIRKDIPFFVQHFGDREVIRAAGFTDVRILTGNPEFEGVKLKKVPGQHGSDAVIQAAYDLLQEVCGVVFSHPKEKTLYLAGDTIWNQYVEANIAEYKPDVIILNAGDAQIPNYGNIIMNKEEVVQVCRAAPAATIVASHMESVNHAMTTRAELREHLARNNLTDRVLVPEDGEICTL
jgi:L-ascorbate metabolism protein UlaG (beta-lactamase superfamily)